MVDQLLNNSHEHPLPLLPLLLLRVYPLHPVLVDRLQSLHHLDLPLLPCPDVSLEYFLQLSQLLGKLFVYPLL